MINGCISKLRFTAAAKKKNGKVLRTFPFFFVVHHFVFSFPLLIASNQNSPAAQICLPGFSRRYE